MNFAMSSHYLVKKGRAALAIFFLSFICSICLAWPPTYGAEFEVSANEFSSVRFNNDQASKSPEKKGQMKLVNHMIERCRSLGCKVVEVKGKWDADYEVQYPDGWYFKISYDPSCVEITFKPSTLETLNEKAALINDHIFKSATQIGFSIAERQNSHFNMGINSAFEGNAEHFLRFFIDYANRPDLALGSLGHDEGNAPPLSILGEDQRQALQKIVEDFKNGKLKSVAHIAAAIQNRVYTRSFIPSWGGADHYQAIGLKYVNRTNLNYRDAPMELRSVWIQDSAEKFILVSRLIEARVKFLKTQTTPILYTASSRTSFSQSELKSRFFIYVEEAGLNYPEFADLLLRATRKAKLADFLVEDRPFEDRIQSLSGYEDLLVDSPWMRVKVVRMLSEPEAQYSSRALELIEKLKLQPKHTASVKTDFIKSILQSRHSLLTYPTCRSVFTH